MFTSRNIYFPHYNYPDDGVGHTTSNRLTHLNDVIGTSVQDDDTDNHNTTNYGYDELGNLNKDEQEEIATIEWTVSGKIKMINRSQGSTKADLEFRYDTMGNRIAKIMKPAGCISCGAFLEKDQVFILRIKSRFQLE